MKKDKINFSFPVTFEDNLERYNDTISKVRCRVFYKYANRNRTYITDEVADMLLSSIAYAPIKGIFDEDWEDFSDHGDSNQDGKIYGIVSGEPNLTWEDYEDDDGVVRTYATVDVLLYTSLYEEAKKIPGKSQSMELYPPSVNGKWDTIDGEEYYVFSSASFFGLQVLGDQVEPCFEGAAFYSLCDSFKCFMQQFEKSLKKEDKSKMHFKLSDDDKYNLIWQKVNPNYNEENDWLVEYSVCSVYDDYCLIRNIETGTVERLYYTKNENDDDVILGDRITAYIIDVTEEELSALNNIKESNNNSFVKANEIFEKGLTFDEKISEKDGILSEKEGLISTLETDKENLSNNLSQVQGELNELKNYKLEVENNKKKEILSKYQKILDAQTYEKYSSNTDDYTIDQLEKSLAYEFVLANENAVFENAGKVRIPRDDMPLTGIEAVLEQYK